MVLPMVDKIVKKKMSGKILKEILENGISAWPSLEGRYLTISGVKF